MRRRPVVAGNWKMYGSRAANASLVAGVLSGLAPRALRNVEVVVCPPFVYAAELSPQLQSANVGLGAQDVCAEAVQGAFTGEVAATMLREVGCSHVIIGHSERRALYAETDELVGRKTLSALAVGLTPIICVGELWEERDSGRTYEVLGHQLSAVLQTLDSDPAGLAGLDRCILAYEPVWAIGTGRTATPGQAQDVHAFIRGLISSRDAKIAQSVRVLYGGSVKPSNARELFEMSDVDGGLIGGASLKAEDFVAIVAAAELGSERTSCC
ncbi:MAG: triose-phosphate isomerase [Gammaproteobacteria bacterium]|nr:triose-phosphate isomerase [Gammaproteobacteria bacterium]